jgi:hypothetical protein
MVLKALQYYSNGEVVRWIQEQKPNAVQRQPRSGATCVRMFSSRWAL